MLQSEPELREWPVETRDERWNRYAWEYLDVVINRLRQWRDASPQLASRVSLPSFDDWLNLTGRYRADGALPS